MQIKLSKPMSVASARAALIAAGGAIVDGYIDVPTPEAAIAGLDYLAPCTASARMRSSSRRAAASSCATSTA